MRLQSRPKQTRHESNHIRLSLAWLHTQGLLVAGPLAHWPLTVRPSALCDPRSSVGPGIRGPEAPKVQPFITPRGPTNMALSMGATRTQGLRMVRTQLKDCFTPPSPLPLGASDPLRPNVRHKRIGMVGCWGNRPGERGGGHAPSGHSSNWLSDTWYRGKRGEWALQKSICATIPLTGLSHRARLPMACKSADTCRARDGVRAEFGWETAVK